MDKRQYKIIIKRLAQYNNIRHTCNEKQKLVKSGLSYGITNLYIIGSLTLILKIKAEPLAHRKVTLWINPKSIQAEDQVNFLN